MDRDLSGMKMWFTPLEKESRTIEVFYWGEENTEWLAEGGNY